MKRHKGKQESKNKSLHDFPAENSKVNVRIFGVRGREKEKENGIFYVNVNTVITLFQAA